MQALIFTNYESTVLALGCLGGFMLLQLLIADVVGLRSRHVPGTPVKADHSKLLFRATRAVANTNESIAIFLVLIVFCIFSGADAVYTGYLAWSFVFTRVVYACCYYANFRAARSSVFALSLVTLLGLLIVGFMT